MKLFKSIDEKFADLGFYKVDENKICVEYRRNHDTYTQVLYLGHKDSGRHLIQSYDLHLFDTKGIGNTMVGLTMYEAELCIKKMKQKGWEMVKY